jgi:hypothetical protein
VVPLAAAPDRRKPYRTSASSESGKVRDSSSRSAAGSASADERAAVRL